MYEENALSGSFFEPVQPGIESSDIDVQPFSFKPELDININNPWDPPAGGTDVSNVLSDAPLPDIYISAFALASPNAGKVSISALNKILGTSGLPHTTIEKILNLAAPTNSSRVNRGEFNVALALVALAQKNMDISIENLIERKQDLPEPILNHLESVNFNRNQSISTRPPVLPSLQADDPWAIPSSNGYTEYASEPSSFTPSTSTAAVPPVTVNLNSEENFQWSLDVDKLTIEFAPEREGFLFKHVNYIVKSQKRGITVVRRYSDFWWLMECLAKRYPFRILPALPPKKIGVNGFYFTVDEAFLEKRRRGLVRFLNFIVRHPVLKEDDLVEMFLTEQSQIAEWRRNNTPNLEEEHVRRQITSEMEERIPDNLDERLDKVYKKLEDTIEHYRNMCNLMERIARRQEGMATDYTRYSLALNSLIEKEKGCYIEDCQNCSQVVIGLEQVSSHFQKTSTVMEDVANATLDTALENLKQHRDLLVSFRETFERKDRLTVNTIETLRSRVTTNQAKLDLLTGKENTEQEIERLKLAIEKDEKDIMLQQKRKLFLRYCFHTEITLFHKSSAFISLLYQNFVNDQIKYSQQLYENWKSLSPKVYDMPNEFG